MTVSGHRNIIVQNHFHRFLRSCCYFRDHAALNRLSVCRQFPFHPVGRKITEEIFIVHLETSLLRISQGSPDGLVEIPHLIGMRVRHPVRTDQAVVMKVVVRSIISVEITSIAVDFHAVTVFPMQGLVHEVPDEAALV